MEHKPPPLFFKKGQSLLEYGLLLALVAVAVIVVLALLGPSIGRSYSNVVGNLGTAGHASPTTAAPTAVPTLAPSPTPDWAFCSDEYEYCAFSGTKLVRYGANGVYTYMTLTNGTHCGNGVFGDPLVGVLKHCHYR